MAEIQGVEVQQAGANAGSSRSADELASAFQIGQLSDLQAAAITYTVPAMQRQSSESLAHYLKGDPELLMWANQLQWETFNEIMKGIEESQRKIAQADKAASEKSSQRNSEERAHELKSTATKNAQLRNFLISVHYSTPLREAAQGHDINIGELHQGLREVSNDLHQAMGRYGVQIRAEAKDVQMNSAPPAPTEPQPLSARQALSPQDALRAPVSDLSVKTRPTNFIS